MSYSSTVLALSPAAYYRHGEASGTTLVDSSGNGRDGTYLGSVLPTLGVAGLLVGDSDTCADFPGGSDGRAEVADAAWMDSSAFTVVARVNGSSMAGVRRGIISRDGTSGNRGWTLYANGGKLELFDGTASRLIAATTMTNGSTHSVALVSNGTTVTLYLDGVSDGSTTYTVSNTLANPIMIGASRAGSATAASFEFDGLIDESAYFTSALSGTDIANLHTAATTSSAITGTFAASVPVAGASFSGSYTPPDETGTFDVDVPVPVPAFTGSYQAPPTGSFAASLTVPVVDFTGSYAPPPDPTGSFAVALPVPVVDFTGGYAPPAISGSFAVDVPLPVVEFTGGVADSLGSFAVTLPVPTVVFEGSYGGPYPTDTSNLFDGLDMVCIGTVTMTRADVVPPTAPPKYDKALPYPEPVMAEGRPT